MLSFFHPCWVLVFLGIFDLLLFFVCGAVCFWLLVGCTAYQSTGTCHQWTAELSKEAKAKVLNIKTAVQDYILTTNQVSLIRPPPDTRIIIFIFILFVCCHTLPARLFPHFRCVGSACSTLTDESVEFCTPSPRWGSRAARWRGTTRWTSSTSRRPRTPRAATASS